MPLPKLTFIHGFMGAPSDWDLYCQAFADYEICTPLIQPAQDWASSVDQLIGELPERSILVGYSMGARLSLAIALERPDLCEGLVFVSGNPGIEDDQLRRLRFQHDCQIADRIESEPREAFLEYWYTESTVFKSLTDEVRADEIRRKLDRSGDDWASILRTNSVAKQPNYWPRLRELLMPTLAIAGMSDRKYANMMSRMERESQIRDFEAQIVPECGHIVHHEKPDVFLRLVKEFIHRLTMKKPSW